jgi:exosortase
MPAIVKSAELETVAPRRIPPNHAVFTGFALACLVPLILTWDATRQFATLVLKDDTYSHIPLIPLVSGFLIYTNRQRIFSSAQRSWSSGVFLALPGVVSLWFSQSSIWEFSSANRPTFLICGFVLIWMALFAAFFGTAAFRAARFPLLFLLFAIPIPEPALSNLVWLLQAGSASAAAAIYRLIGVPFVREGFVFGLPGVTIRVAEECSGIRSALALFITTVLAAHLWIKSKASTFALWVLVFPVAIVKNGMRIVTLSCLAVYLDPSFLYGRLHRYGGIPFFLLDLIMMGVAFHVALRLERQPRGRVVVSTIKSNAYNERKPFSV